MAQQQRHQPQRKGGGGGGGNKNKVPPHGLYADKAGEAQANQEPEEYIKSLLSQAGMLHQTGTPYDDWANNQLVANTMQKYQDAVSINQSLSPEDFMRSTYGAGYTTTGKKKSKGGKGKTTTFNAGTLGNEASGLPDDYQDFQSNTDMAGFMRTQGIKGGAVLEGGGNSDFQNYYTNVHTPGVIGALGAARAQPGPATPATVVGGGDAGNPAVGKPPGEPLEGGGKGKGGGNGYRGQGPGGGRDLRHQQQQAQAGVQAAQQMAGIAPAAAPPAPAPAPAPAATGGAAIYGAQAGGGGGGGRGNHRNNGPGGGGGGASVYGAQGGGGGAGQPTVGTQPVAATGGKGGGKGRGGGKSQNNAYNTTDNPAPLTTPPSTAPDPTTGPQTSLNDFVNQLTPQQDTLRARNEYAFRPNAQRLPYAQQLAGRYSWWE